MKRWWGASMLGLLVALGDAGAQSVSLGASAGVAVPKAALAARRTAAPYIAASALFGSPERFARFRIDFDAARFWGRTQAGFSGPIDHGDLTVTSALGHVVLGPRGREARPYTLIGIGMHWMSIPGRRNPYGTVWGVGVGGGAEFPIRRIALKAETRAHVILSDYGNSDFETSAFWPLMIGVRF
jgi:hypothetical protein